MNKKKYISFGFFAIIIMLGGGVAYYFDPGAINTILGINSAQVGSITDADLPIIDTTSSSEQDTFPGEPVVAAPVPAKKASSGGKSAQPSASSAENDSAPSDQSVVASATQLLNGDDNLSDDASSSLMATSSCSFPSAAPSTTQQVTFNEIAWMGSVSSSIAEWMEIKNNSTSTVDLSGWKLVNASGKIAIAFSDSDMIAPDGLFLLLRGSSASASSSGVSAATKIYSGDLVNGGDTLALMDPQCNVSDYLDASHGWPAGNNVTKATMERDAVGGGWHTSALPGGTPGAENSAGAPIAPSSTPAIANATSSIAIAAPAPPSATTTVSSTASIPDSSSTSISDASTSDDTAPAASSSLVAAPPVAGSTHILIAAVQIAGATSDNDFVKLYNPTAAAVDMSGWKLHKKSETGADYSLKSLPTGSVIGPGQSFVWANSEDGFSEAIGANVSSTETLSADNSVALLDGAGNVVDAVAWGTGTGQYGEGPPYPTSPGANQLLSRRSSGAALADTGSNINDFTLQ